MSTDEHRQRSGTTTPGAPARPGSRSASRTDSRTGSRTDSRAGSRPDSRSPRRSGLTGRFAILVLVLAALVVSYASSLRAFVDQRSRIAALHEEVAQRTSQVAELNDELTRWNDKAYVEAQARERFGWVMPGEIGYVVVRGNEDPEAHTAGGSHDRPAKRHPAWWHELWGSVEAAGKPTPGPHARTSAPKRPKPAETIVPVDPADSGLETQSQNQSRSQGRNGAGGER